MGAGGSREDASLTEEDVGLSMGATEEAQSTTGVGGVKEEVSSTRPEAASTSKATGVKADAVCSGESTSADTRAGGEIGCATTPARAVESGTEETSGADRDGVASDGEVADNKVDDKRAPSTTGV